MQFGNCEMQKKPSRCSSTWPSRRRLKRKRWKFEINIVLLEQYMDGLHLEKINGSSGFDCFPPDHGPIFVRHFGPNF